jgi:hypothetical protein
LIALIVLAAGCRPRAGDHPPTGGVGHAAGDGGTTPGDGGGVATQNPGPAPKKPRPPQVKIMVRTVPPKAQVRWGKKLLGETPYQLDRPRDSGPVDLVVRMDGYFPVHTRAYTYHSDTIYLKLTKLTDRMTLFGAKKEVPQDTPPPQPPPPAAPQPPTPTPPKG